MSTKGFIFVTDRYVSIVLLGMMSECIYYSLKINDTRFGSINWIIISHEVEFVTLIVSTLAVLQVTPNNVQWINWLFSSKMLQWRLKVWTPFGIRKYLKAIAQWSSLFYFSTFTCNKIGRTIIKIHFQLRWFFIRET